MFRFFYTGKWLSWSIFGTAFIIAATWYQATLDVKINDWFGEFYDSLQTALAKPGTVTEKDIITLIMTFGMIAGVWIVVAAIKDFFTSHWIFRWRQSMSEYYHMTYNDARHIEGASQRVQEDTLKFARIIETLGVGLLDALFILILFTPKLQELSTRVTELPWIGHVDGSLVWLAIMTAIGGTVILAIVGFKLPRIEYDIQKEEAAYRKELVLGEIDPLKAPPTVVSDLFSRVRKIHFKSYFHYAYFNLVRWSYFQGMVVVPYVALAPTIVSGAVTLGFIQQIVRAFDKVEKSMQYIVRSWPTIVELLSVYKRLREFEQTITRKQST